MALQKPTVPFNKLSCHAVTERKQLPQQQTQPSVNSFREAVFPWGSFDV